MRNNIADLFDDLFNHNLFATTQLTYPPVNVYKQDDSVVLEVAVAGFDQSELSVEFDGQQLTVKGTKEKAADDNRKWVTRELSSRSFTRSFAVSGQFEPQQPTLHNGVLTIVLKGLNVKKALPISLGIPQLKLTNDT